MVAGVGATGKLLQTSDTHILFENPENQVTGRDISGLVGSVKARGRP
ncbi:MAG: hypothetical protein J07HX5_00890, partial [halophilic archaeon J07HX5]